MDQHEARSRDILACLGDPSRFRLALSLLEGERCVTELAGQVGLSQSCTTRHLQYLEREGLVRGVRQGKRVMYQLRSDRSRVRDLLAWVTAATSDSMPQRVSGAEVHIDGAGRPAGIGLRAAPDRTRRKPPAQPDPVADPAASPGSDSGTPMNSKEMEDWLL